MGRLTLWTCLFVAMFTCALYAQGIAGDWQGTLKISDKDSRLIVHIEKAESGSWKALLGRIDQTPDWGAREPADSITLQGSDVQWTFPSIRGKFEGKLSADGTSIAGTWGEGRTVEMRRATPATAWKDPSPHAVQFVAVGNDVNLGG